MKILNYILVCAVAFVFAVSCNEGIDPITPIDPGADETAPTVVITSPVEGGLLKVAEGAGVPVMFEAADDIELKSVSIVLDGTEVENITSFMDYRRYSPIKGYLLGSLENGAHTLKVTATDLTGKSTTSAEVAFTVINISEFVPAYGEIFYMSFDNSTFEFASLTDPEMTGTTGYAEGKVGQAMAGATDSYLTFPTDNLANAEFSATFWININPDPDRSGMLTMGPEDTANPDAQNKRTSGFRIFRELRGLGQIIKLNLGNGTTDGWLDGGDLATVYPDSIEWLHVAFTISTDHVALYFDGVVVSEIDFGPIDWTGCDIFTIASGVPRFTGWAHYSDLSLYDELRIFDKALTQEEIQAIIDAEI